MNEQLISLRTAVLAKEKGFKINWLSDYYSLTDKKQYGRSVGFSPELYNCDNDTHIGLSTQSQLQTWLRNNHNICVYVLPVITTKDTKLYYSWGIIGLNSIGYTCDPHRRGESYEEELEAGLYKTLERL